MAKAQVMSPDVASSQSVAKPRHKIEVALVVTGKTQHKMRNAGSRIAAQPLRQALARTSIARLPFSHCGGGLPIVALKIVIQPIAGANGIVVDHHGEVHGPDEGGWITPGLPGDGLDFRPLLLPLLRIRRNRHPAVEVTTRALAARRQ